MDVLREQVGKIVYVGLRRSGARVSRFFMANDAVLLATMFLSLTKDLVMARVNFLLLGFWLLVSYLIVVKIVVIDHSENNARDSFLTTLGKVDIARLHAFEGRSPEALLKLNVWLEELEAEPFWNVILSRAATMPVSGKSEAESWNERSRDLVKEFYDFKAQLKGDVLTADVDGVSVVRRLRHETPTDWKLRYAEWRPLEVRVLLGLVAVLVVGVIQKSYIMYRDKYLS